MKHVFLLICVMLLSCPLMTAQEAPSLPKQVKVGKPAILKPENGTYKRSDLEREFCTASKWGTKNTIQEYWTVFSDRNDNPLYADAAKLQKLGTSLRFNEQVVIAEVKGDMALVYADAKQEHYPTIPSYAKSLGWIPMENLLLWDKCPTDTRGVQYKAILAINLNKMGGGRQFQGKYYENPEGEEFAHDLPTDMKFYFILKEAGKGNDMRVLLCSNPTVQGNNLLGWVDNNAYSTWIQRACLEPNWDPKFIANHKGTEVGVYATEFLKSGDKVKSWEYGKQNGVDRNPYSYYRMDPQQLRFPILDKVDEHAEWIYCLVLSSYDEDNVKFDAAFLKKYLGEVGYEQWKEKKMASVYEGYTPRKDSEGNNYWNYVLYLSGDELYKLLNDLKPVYTVAKAQSDDRKPYVDAMRALIKAHYGQLDDKGIDAMDADQLMELIYGVDVHTEMTNHRKLKDIRNPRVVTTIEYRKILKTFSDNYEKIQKYYNDGYTYRVQLGTDYFYWIPIDELP